MDAAAVAVMIIGMTIIWGGLVLSILNAVRTSRARRRAGERG